MSERKKLDAIELLKWANNADSVPDYWIGMTIAKFGGTYHKADPGVLSIVGVTVAARGGAGDLVRAWLIKAGAAVDE